MKGRGLAFDVVIYALGDVFLKGVLFLTLPVYTRLFSPADYGLLSATLVLVSLVSSALILGGDTAYARFFFATKDESERRSLTTLWIVFLGSVSLVGVAILIPLSTVVAQGFFHGRGAAVLAIGLASIPPAIVNDMLGQGLRNEFRGVAFVSTNLLIGVADVGLGIVLATAGHMGLLGIVAGTALGECLTLPVRVWLLRRLFTRRLTSHYLRPLLLYGLPLVPASISYWVFTVSDRLLLARLTTLVAVGLYSAANAVVGVVALLNGAVGQAWSPHAVRMFEQHPDDASRAFGDVMLAILVVDGFLCVAVSALAPELLRVLATAAFVQAAPAVTPLALALIAIGSTQVTALGISLKNRTRYIAEYAAIAAAVNVVLCLVLIPPFGIEGAAWATTGAYLFLTLCYLWRSQRLYRVVYDQRRCLTAIGLALLFSLATLIVPTTVRWAWLPIKLLYVGVFALALFAGGVVGPRSSGALRKLFARA